MYDAWGGKAGLRWAESKLNSLELAERDEDGKVNPSKKAPKK